MKKRELKEPSNFNAPATMPEMTGTMRATVSIVPDAALETTYWQLLDGWNEKANPTVRRRGVTVPPEADQALATYIQVCERQYGMHPETLLESLRERLEARYRQTHQVPAGRTVILPRPSPLN